jgi:hypothetical protein
MLAYLALVVVSPKSWSLRKGSWSLAGILALALVLLVRVAGPDAGPPFTEFVRGWRDGRRRPNEASGTDEDTGEATPTKTRSLRD